MARPAWLAPLLWRVTLGVTVVIEGVTVGSRLASGQSAAEFNARSHPPLLLQIHHMFWSLPVMLVAWVVRGRAVSNVCWGPAFGLVASDVLHHLVVLPIWAGNMGWHWP